MVCTSNLIKCAKNKKHVVYHKNGSYAQLCPGWTKAVFVYYGYVCVVFIKESTFGLNLSSLKKPSLIFD